MHRNLFFLLAAAGFGLAGIQSSSGSVVFSSDLDSAVGWTVVGDTDTASTFGFDYSAFGIPPAPSGTGTTGLRLAANISSATASYISAAPTLLNVSGKYRVKVDMWLNFNTSGGTTEFGGVFVGYNPLIGQVRNGAGLYGNTDGDSLRDFRLFKDGNEQFVESGQYAIPSQDSAVEPLPTWFPGGTTPAAQGQAPFDPTNVIVTAANGTLGFGWHVVTVDVDSDAGTAQFNIDGNTIGTIDANIGNSVNLDGSVALSYADIFTSVSNKPEFSFGVFDHLEVSIIPEPGVSVLLALSGCGLLLRRRRDAEA